MFSLLRKGVIRWLQHKRPLPTTPLSDFERIRHELKPCDIVLVEGRSRVSEVIKLITQSSWSHAALYIGRMHDIENPLLKDMLRKHYIGTADKQLIIESELGTGTVVRALTQYEKEHLRICRPRNLGFHDSQQVIAYAIGRLGTAYDVRQIFDLARFLFPWWILPRRWRSSLFKTNPGHNTHTVCSTMIAEAFGSIHFPILPLVKKLEGDRYRLYMRNPKLCTPSDFDYSPYFDIIKYPFLDFQQYADQRMALWTGAGAGELSEKEQDMYVSVDEIAAPQVDEA
ncbi:MAG: YiiX/YebB-like N1pC/P60 family cysteine hydrolase [Parahaliea sp.]